MPGGLEIVPRLNQLLDVRWARIDASQDWHPPDHCSFLGRRDDLYPPHCVMGTPGADFLPGLRAERFHALWRKGFERDRDAYAVTAQHPAFPAMLRGSGLTTVVVCGIATNICCFYAARDLRRAGFRVALVEDASAGLDVPAANLFQAAAKAEGAALGIEYVATAELLASVVGGQARSASEGLRHARCLFLVSCFPHSSVCAIRLKSYKSASRARRSRLPIRSGGRSLVTGRSPLGRLGR